jgi:hypothetical protein
VCEVLHIQTFVTDLMIQYTACLDGSSDATWWYWSQSSTPARGEHAVDCEAQDVSHQFIK